MAESSSESNSEAVSIEDLLLGETQIIIEEPAKNPATEKLFAQLQKALKEDGNFPSSAKAITNLRALASDPKTTSTQIAELILKEPSLATRLLHIVNSSFYRRAKPIMTVSQAVLQFGMEPLVEIFSGITLLKSFTAGNKDSHFGNCIKKTICTSLITSSVMPIMNPGESTKNELGYLLGMFSEIGTLSLAHYFPRIYETALKQSELSGNTFDQCLKDIVGVYGSGLSLEVIKSLDVPPLYKSAVHACAHPELSAKAAHSMERIVNAIKISQEISNAIVLMGTPGALDKALEGATTLGIDPHKLRKAIGLLPEQFTSYCEALDINVTSLPEFISSYAIGLTEPSQKIDVGSIDRLTSFVDEVKGAVLDKAPSAAVITIVMETLAWGLKFDRVLLLLKNKATNELVGRTLIGQSTADPKSIIRPMNGGNDRFAPDAKALKEGSAVFTGNPLFSNGWPIVAIPVGFGERCVGVITLTVYAIDLSSDGEVLDREKAAIAIMADLIDKSLGSSKK